MKKVGVASCRCYAAFAYLSALMGTTKILGSWIYRPYLQIVSYKLRLSKTELLNTAAKDVCFTGVLNIENRKWLSAEGIKSIEGDILRRDQSIHHPKAYSKKLLRLKAMYAPEITFQSSNPTVKVLIKCEKRIPASFMTRTFSYKV